MADNSTNTMFSVTLHVDEVSDKSYIDDRIYKYTGAFYHAYKAIEEITDSNFKDKIRRKYCLNDCECRSLISDVSAIRSAEIEATKTKGERIELLSSFIVEKEIDNKHKCFKTKRQIANLKKRLGVESSFGDTSILSKLNKEHNKSAEEKDLNLIQQLTTEYKESRKKGIYLLGEANQKGNRFFDFSKIFTENVLTYKRDKQHHIDFKLKLPNHKSDYYKNLKKAIELTEAKELSITVRLFKDRVIFSFDLEAVNGYALKTKERKADVKEIKNQHHPEEIEKEIINTLYKKYYVEQTERKLFDKIRNRFISIDINPNYISYVIFDMDFETQKMTIIKCGCFDISKLNKKSKKSSSDEKSKYLNRKRNYELSIVVKKLFGLIRHYKVSAFIIEDLSMKLDKKESVSREFHRLTRNVWCRTALTNFIERRCAETGVELRKINACYTSFIGNIKNNYFDPVNAAIEIGRRGSLKYIKDTFYPLISTEDLDTLETKFKDYITNIEVLEDETFEVEFSDGQRMTCINWISFYKSLTKFIKEQTNSLVDFGNRLRTTLYDSSYEYLTCRLNSNKSHVTNIIFDIK